MIYAENVVWGLPCKILLRFARYVLSKSGVFIYKLFISLLAVSTCVNSVCLCELSTNKAIDRFEKKAINASRST